jgi:Sec-independent protein translocase protein TatA
MVIVGVVLLLMGPDKLPEVAHKLGSTWRAIKNLQEKVESEIREAIPDLPSTGDIARIARSPVNLLNQLADRVDAKEAAERLSATTNETVSEEAPPPLVSPPVPPPRMASTNDASLPPDPSLN